MRGISCDFGGCPATLRCLRTPWTTSGGKKVVKDGSLIKKYENLQITFLPSHSKIVDRERMIFNSKLLNEYNKQMKQIIQNLKTEHNFNEDKLNFMDILTSIAETPNDKIPLVSDTTHLNWPISKFNSKSTVQVPAQLTINNILLNFYCQNQLKTNNNKYCCF